MNQQAVIDGDKDCGSSQCFKRFGTCYGPAYHTAFGQADTSEEGEWSLEAASVVSSPFPLSGSQCAKIAEIA